jgi:hypothetical protein
MAVHHGVGDPNLEEGKKRYKVGDVGVAGMFITRPWDN